MEKQLIEKIQELTSKLTPIKDIAILLNIPESVLLCEIGNPESDISKIYYLTKAQVALKIREQNMELAEAGSPTAADSVSLYLKSMANDEP